MAEKTAAAVLEGPVHTWSVRPDGADARRYLAVTVPYGVARRAFKPDRFSAQTGRGEQRELVPAQVAALERAMRAGTYTPTAVSAGLRDRHREHGLAAGPDGRATLTVFDGDPLPLTDGQQRFGALAKIRDAAEKAGEADLVAAVDAAPVTALVLLDGNTKVDFLNLQLGRSVDATHLLSLRVHARLLGDREQAGMRAALEAAKVLDKHQQSPFFKLVRLDSKGGGAAVAGLPFSTLAARGASDLATSLFGLAKAAAAGTDPVKLAGLVVAAYQAVRAEAPALLQEGHPLTPPAEHGTKGAATMLVGLGVGLAYRLRALGRDLPEDDDLDRLVKAARRTLGRPVQGNFSGPVKRAYMGEFAAEFLADLPEPKHEGVPVGLLQALSCSAFAVEKLPAGKKGPKPAPAPAGPEDDDA